MLSEERWVLAQSGRLWHQARSYEVVEVQARGSEYGHRLRGVGDLEALICCCHRLSAQLPQHASVMNFATALSPMQCRPMSRL